MQTADCDEIIGLISAKVPDVHEQQTDGNAIWLTIEDDFRALRDLLDENERGWRGRIKDEHLETEFNEVG